MEEIIIRQLTDTDEMPWDLLLLADPSKEKVNKYLPSSRIYLAEQEGAVIGEKEEIVENGIKCLDMIRLSLSL